MNTLKDLTLQELEFIRDGIERTFMENFGVTLSQKTDRDDLYFMEMRDARATEYAAVNDEMNRKFDRGEHKRRYRFNPDRMQDLSKLYLSYIIFGEFELKRKVHDFLTAPIMQHSQTGKILGAITPQFSKTAEAVLNEQIETAEVSAMDAAAELFRRGRKNSNDHEEENTPKIPR